MRFAILVGAWISAIAGPVCAQSFDPRAHRAFAGPPSEILVLGTPHLAALPDNFRVDSLAPVLDRLASWKPDIITIEAISGADCEMLRRYKAQFGAAADSFCWDPAPATRATGLTVVAATAQAQRLLAGWPAHPAAAERRRLAAVFLAAGDRASALVQWLRLPIAERRAGDGLDAALVAILGKLESDRNERYAVAAVLAARLGLERVHATDDHSADAIVADVDKPFVEALKRVRAGAGPRREAFKAQEAKLGTPQATLDYYRYVNQPREAADAFTYDFGAALKDEGVGFDGRRYVGWWETRNLRMVANLRAVLAARPGARALTIVGASHKGYFEAYLAMMHDVRLVDANAILE
jgi:hypothetical protein